MIIEMGLDLQDKKCFTLELLERLRLMFYQLKYDMDLVDKVIEKETLYLWG